MLSGKRKKDYAAESTADALTAQAAALGLAPEMQSFAHVSADADDADASAEEELVAA